MTKTKKLINAPETIISEMIAGMVGAHPDILTVEGATGRAVVAVDGPRDGKVGVVVGGGGGGAGGGAGECDGEQRRAVGAGGVAGLSD